MGLFIPRKDHHFVWCSDKLSMGSVAASWDDHPKCPVFNKHQFKSISPGCGLSSLYIYIIIHIYSVSRIKQKSENSFRTPLNIFPFFFSRSTRKVHFAIYHWGSNVPPGCHGDEGLHPCVQTSPATDRDTHQWRPAGGAFQGGDPFKIKWFIVDL